MSIDVVAKRLIDNEAFLKKTIGESADIKYRHLDIPALGSDALIVYVSGLVDTRVIDQTILEPLMTSLHPPRNQVHVGNRKRISELIDYGVFTSMVKEAYEWHEICDAILEGDTALLVDHCDSSLILSTRKYEGRAVEEPATESEVKGPRDGFVENIQTNAALIRRRIKDYGLRFEDYKMGERTKTAVFVVYIEGLTNQSLLKEVRIRLQRIKIDGVLASSYLEEFLEDSPFSIFPQTTSTERPDRACAALLEGRVVILVDNTPFALTLPVVFWQFLLSSGDYYERYVIGTLIRWIRMIALSLSISLSPLYVLLTSFHQEMLPTVLALKIAEDRSRVPFPAFLEAFAMEVVLEIMKEAGLRMPKPIVQTVSIVGTLVIGQAAVSAGLVAPLMLIVIAVAAISSYAIPSFGMSNTLRLLRFPLLILSATFGLLGYLGGIMALLLHLMSLRSFGTPYFAPISPFRTNGLRDVLTRSPWWTMSTRPLLARPQDKMRQPGNTRQPRPPTKQQNKREKE